MTTLTFIFNDTSVSFSIISVDFDSGAIYRFSKIVPGTVLPVTVKCFGPSTVESTTVMLAAVL